MVLNICQLVGAPVLRAKDYLLHGIWTNVYKSSLSESYAYATPSLNDSLPTFDRTSEQLHVKCKSFICSVCHKTFRHKCNLTAHMRLHTGSAYIASEKDDKQFICGVCTFKTNNLVDWKSHELSYGHRQTFACPICEKKFTQKCNMKAHIRLHTGEKPYKCKLCFQTFTYQSALRGHMMARHKISVNYSQTEMQTIN
ncbi:zinc finger protein 658B-like [Argiope bruennichi]|uniref:zinc finger protein 658B-like n=1 Tax=Argiope bruennichi TaxID=94029 RepID=UPI0024948B0B|nr:zinc finger protein 658B-like [Argiope bruennichi]